VSSFGPWVTARWQSECDYCGDAIYEDEKLRSDGEGCWICETCGQDDLDD